MNETTPENIDKLIDLLSDKTLEFGQRVGNVDNTSEVYFNSGIFIDFIEKKRGDWKWAMIWDGDLINEVCEEDLSSGGKILGKDIMIGDVLERLSDKENLRADFIKINRILLLWQPCGFNRSLQEIVEESGYEEVGFACKDCDYIGDLKSVQEHVLSTKMKHCVVNSQRLRSQEARALCEFLLDLFL